MAPAVLAVPAPPALFLPGGVHRLDMLLYCMPEMLMPKNIAGVGTCCKQLEPDFWFVATL